MVDEAALVLAMELLDSGDEDEELIGIMALQRYLADEEDEEMALVVAAAVSDRPHTPEPYILYVWTAWCLARLWLRWMVASIVANTSMDELTRGMPPMPLP